MALRLRSLASPLSRSIRQRYIPTGPFFDPRRAQSSEPGSLVECSLSKSDTPPSSSSFLNPVDLSSPSPPPTTDERGHSSSLGAEDSNRLGKSPSETAEDSFHPPSSPSTFPSSPSSASPSPANHQLEQPTGAPIQPSESSPDPRPSLETSSPHPTVPNNLESSSPLDPTVDSKTDAPSAARTNEDRSREGAPEPGVAGSEATAGGSGMGERWKTSLAPRIRSSNSPSPLSTTSLAYLTLAPSSSSRPPPSLKLSASSQSKPFKKTSKSHPFTSTTSSSPFARWENTLTSSLVGGQSSTSASAPPRVFTPSLTSSAPSAPIPSSLKPFTVPRPVSSLPSVKLPSQPHRSVQPPNPRSVRTPTPSHPPLRIAKPLGRATPERSKIHIRHLPCSTLKPDGRLDNILAPPPYRLDAIQGALSMLGLGAGMAGQFEFDQKNGLVVTVDKDEEETWLALDGMDIQGERFVVQWKRSYTSEKGSFLQRRSPLVSSSSALSIPTPSIIVSSSSSLRSSPASTPLRLGRPSPTPRRSPHPSPLNPFTSSPSTSSLPSPPPLLSSLPPTANFSKPPSPQTPPPVPISTSNPFTGPFSTRQPPPTQPSQPFVRGKKSKRVPAGLPDFLNPRSSSWAAPSSTPRIPARPPPSFISLPTRAVVPPVVLQPPPDFVPSKTSPVQLACVWFTLQRSTPGLAPLQLSDVDPLVASLGLPRPLRFEVVPALSVLHPVEGQEENTVIGIAVPPEDEWIWLAKKEAAGVKGLEIRLAEEEQRSIAPETLDVPWKSEFSSSSSSSSSPLDTLVEFRAHSHLGRRLPIGTLYTSLLAIGMSYAAAKNQSSSDSDPNLCVRCETAEEANRLLTLNESRQEFGTVYATRPKLPYKNYLPEVIILVGNVPVEVDFADLEAFFASAGVQCKAIRREAIRDGVSQVSMMVSLEDRERMLFLSGKGAVGDLPLIVNDYLRHPTPALNEAARSLRLLEEKKKKSSPKPATSFASPIAASPPSTPSPSPPTLSSSSSSSPPPNPPVVPPARSTRLDWKEHIPRLLLSVSNVPLDISRADLTAFFASGGVECEFVRREKVQDNGLVEVSVLVKPDQREKMLGLSGLGASGQTDLVITDYNQNQQAQLAIEAAESCINDPESRTWSTESFDIDNSSIRSPEALPRSASPRQVPRPTSHFGLPPPFRSFD